jgi:DNA-directed RNA polymerase I, II, and III subunit RPABC3
MSIASTLSHDGTKDDAANSKTGWRETRSGEPTLADAYDYVCYGKVYRFEEGNGEYM